MLEGIFQEALSRGFVGDMIELPDIVEPASVALDRPAVYGISADGKRLTLESVDLAARPLIVAVVNPGCRFRGQTGRASTLEARRASIS